MYDQLEKLRDIVEISETFEDGDEDVKTVENIYNNAKEKTDTFIAELEYTWSTVVSNLRDKAKAIFKPFQEFGSPWDNQAASFTKLQYSVIQQLENKALKNELGHIDMQHKIDGEIVKLREEENAQKLDKRFAQLVAILDKKIQK